MAVTKKEKEEMEMEKAKHHNKGDAVVWRYARSRAAIINGYPNPQIGVIVDTGLSPQVSVLFNSGARTLIQEDDLIKLTQ